MALNVIRNDNQFRVESQYFCRDFVVIGFLILPKIEKRCLFFFACLESRYS